VSLCAGCRVSSDIYINPLYEQIALGLYAGERLADAPGEWSSSAAPRTEDMTNGRAREKSGPVGHNLVPIAFELAVRLAWAEGCPCRG
jgi:hypothetical protein